MINSTVRTAKEKLALHRLKGVSSNLTIFEVATLMDKVKNNYGVTSELKKPIFFNAFWN
jgi:hypothetical protein